MPFTADGIRPDLIINPHAIPSRMTIGQIVESLFGIVCAEYGAFGDCTAFQVKGSNYSTYAPLLVKAGFNSTGNHVMYNGMTGEQLEADIYMGPTYYMRLKHMVKDKINFRARGPNTVLTRQPVQGRANDGGLRIGEMERDGIAAHGMAGFLNESLMIRGEKSEYYLAVCNKTGNIAIYNEAKNLFLSPYADGPIQFTVNPDGSQNIKNLSKFGRSFSILRVPYALKLLIQELQVMNVQMRIITDDNVDQLMSMSYSNNINKLLKNNDPVSEKTFKDYNFDVRQLLREQEQQSNAVKKIPIEEPQFPEPVVIETPENITPSNQETPQFFPQTPPDNSPPPYAPGSPAYAPQTPPDFSSQSAKIKLSPEYAPGSPEYAPESPAYAPSSPVIETSTEKTILDITPPEEETKKEESLTEEASSNEKKVIITEPSNSSTEINNSETSEVRKITI